MKPVTTALGNLLAAGGPYLMADLYTLTTKAGNVYRWTASDLPVTLGAYTWTAAADNGAQPLIKRGAIRSAVGLEVDTLDVTLSGGQSAMVGAVRLGLFAASGGLDGARLKVERCFLGTDGNSDAGSITLFEGAVAGVDPSATKVVLRVKSDLERLEIQMPRTLISPTCNNTFGDAGCGISLASKTEAGTTGAGSTTTSLLGAPSHAADYWADGWVIFASGACQGLRRSVRAYPAGGALALAHPLPVAPAPGDTFTVTPGCPRTRTACAGWANLANFRGYPFVPVPETAY